MNFMIPFQPPSEIEMFEHGFGLSPDHDPEGAVVSFLRSYNEGIVLEVTFTMEWTSSIFVSITQNGKITSEVNLDCIEQGAFQSWHQEQIMRFLCRMPSTNCDLRIHYDPTPSIHFSALLTSA